jgi:hypothetical protein
LRLGDAPNFFSTKIFGGSKVKIVKPDIFQQFNEMPDEKLFNYVTEVESSERRHVAQHILEIRRSEPLRKAAEASVRAAEASVRTTIWATIAAFISAIAAVIALIRH